MHPQGYFIKVCYLNQLWFNQKAKKFLLNKDLKEQTINSLYDFYVSYLFSHWYSIYIKCVTNEFTISENKLEFFILHYEMRVWKWQRWIFTSGQFQKTSLGICPLLVDKPKKVFGQRFWISRWQEFFFIRQCKVGDSHIPTWWQTYTKSVTKHILSRWQKHILSRWQNIYLVGDKNIY